MAENTSSAIHKPLISDGSQQNHVDNNNIHAADPSNINGIVPVSVKITSKPASIRLASTQINIENLIDQINDGSYKEQHLTFWERFCVFFEHLFTGRDLDLALGYLVKKIENEENKIDFATALIEEISKTEDPNKKEILRKTFVEILHNIENERSKTRLAAALIEGISKTEDLSKKEILGKIFIKILLNTDYKKAIKFFSNFIGEISRTQDNDNLISALGYVAVKCTNTPNFIKNFLMRVITPRDSEKKVLNKILASILSHKYDMVKQGLEDIKNSQAPSAEFQNLVNSINSDHVENIEITKNNDDSSKLTFNTRQTQDETFIQSVINPNKDVLMEGIQALKAGEKPSKKFETLLKTIPDGYYKLIEKILGFDEKTIKNGSYIVYTLLPNAQDIKNGLDAIASISDPHNTKVPSQKFFKIVAELDSNSELREQMSEVLKKMNFDPVRVHHIIFGYVAFVANSKFKTKAYCHYLREAGNSALADTMEERQYSSPLMSEESFNNFASNFEKLRDEAFLKFFDKKISNPTSDPETQTECENFKRKFEQSLNNRDIAFLNDFLLEIIKAFCKTDEEVLFNNPGMEIFKILLSIMQEKQGLIFNDVDADFGEIYDEANPQKTSDNFARITYVLARELMCNYLFPMHVASLGGDDIGNFATAMQNAYIQKQQEELWHEVPGYDKDFTESSNQTAASES